MNPGQIMVDLTMKKAFGNLKQIITFDANDGINYLKSADYIIYQKIKPTTSELFNYEKVEEYAKPRFH